MSSKKANQTHTLTSSAKKMKQCTLNENNAFKTNTLVGYLVINTSAWPWVDNNDILLVVGFNYNIIYIITIFICFIIFTVSKKFTIKSILYIA